jgi:CBS domain-containing protein
MAAIRDVMSTELVSVEPDATVAEAATVMGTRKVGAALVMDAGRLAGIFTERDILRALASDFDAAGHVVSHWMTTAPRTLPPDADTARALALMLDGGFRHVPIVSGELVVGIVSMRDVTPRD